MTSTLGKYHLIEPLGRGGFGTVYRARHTTLNVEHAVKILHPALTSDPEFIARFRQEAQIAARIDHPHIVPVYDLGELDGRFFLAMKLMPGGSLKDRLAKDGRLPYAEAVRIITQVAAALDFAYRTPEKLIHRDIKPGNILLEADGTARLSDFGFAKALEGGGSGSLSTSGGLIGTFAYLAPEIWNAQPASPASDQYSLACVFYELITGESLFGSGDSPLPVVMKRHLDPLALPAQWPDGVAARVTAILTRALAKTPGGRYSSSGEFARDLERSQAQAQLEVTEARRRQVTSMSKVIEAAIINKDWNLAGQKLTQLESDGPEGKAASAGLAARLEEARRQQTERIDEVRNKILWAIDAKEWAFAEQQLGRLQGEDTAGQAAAAALHAQLNSARQQQMDRVTEEKRKAAQALSIQDWTAAEAAIKALNHLGKEGQSAADLVHSQLVRALQQVSRQASESQTLLSASTKKPPILESHMKIPRWLPWSAGLLAFFVISGLVASFVITQHNPARATQTAQARLSQTTETLLALPAATDTLTSSPIPPSATTPVPLLTSPVDGMVLMFIPGGNFQMGEDAGRSLEECQLLYEPFSDKTCLREWFTDEGPVHAVTLAAFWMDQTEVTNGMYTLCVADGVCSPPNSAGSYTRDSYYGNTAYVDYPVIYVDWTQAAAYCQWAGRKLPTEAQWEYAARGGFTGALYPWGNTFNGNLANFCDASCSLGWSNNSYNDGYADSAPVGSYPANGYGLYDMAGNVWEWVADRYGSYLEGAVFYPTGPDSGTSRLLRGGSWYSDGGYLRVSDRFRGNPANSSYYFGFRCAHSP
ncbi:MAG: SUMF1/EgtB/PvdO family nonheme iron enzyme [Anaerolineales bacterium]|jgi:formylglycine-generating enzyme required for sulfatase activity/serine/threonine protein kinase|nr:SUMF1/EgtB/PvdO family nonheme iron enzyme [Anaerolineales bacterium]